MKICFFLGKQVDVSKETGGNKALPITRTEEGDTSILRRVKKHKSLIIAGSLLLLLCLVLTNNLHKLDLTSASSGIGHNSHDKDITQDISVLFFVRDGS